MSNQKGQNFMLGAFILMASNIAVKIIGALFKIPLTNLIHSEGMSYFNNAYSVYISFYMISTAGIPVAISRMIAQANAKGNRREIDRIYKIAFWVFFAIGVISTGIMIGLSRFFANDVMKNPGCVYSIIAIAPTIFFICICSAYRGYYQGVQNMVPTAVSQVIESACKLVIGLVAAWYFVSIGLKMEYVSAIVISGVTIGVMFCTLYLFICKQKTNRELKGQPYDTSLNVRSVKDLAYELVITSIPISLSASIMGLSNLVDSAIIARRLIDTGMAEELAKKYYGAYSAIPVTLFNMPTTLIYPFAISVLPLLSALIAKKEDEKARQTMDGTFRMTAIISLPCALGLSALAYPIISFLYTREEIHNGITNFDITAMPLSILAIAIFFVGLIAVTNSMLQAYKLQNLTIISTCLGIVAKAVSEYILVGIPGFDVAGAAISSLICYFTIMVMNIYFLVKKVRYFPSIRRVFLKPFLASLICALAALVSYKLFVGILSPKISTIASIVVAVIVYFVGLIVFRGLAKEDVMLLPMGTKLCSLLTKLHVFKKED